MVVVVMIVTMLVMVVVTMFVLVMVMMAALIADVDMIIFDARLAKHRSAITRTTASIAHS
jgi:hypothetical protein